VVFRIEPGVVCLIIIYKLSFLPVEFMLDSLVFSE
jgi:hypothetical protein